MPRENWDFKNVILLEIEQLLVGVIIAHVSPGCLKPSAEHQQQQVTVVTWLFHALSENFLLVFVRFFTLEN